MEEGGQWVGTFIAGEHPGATVVTGCQGERQVFL